VKEFTHLGFLINCRDDLEEEIKRRIITGNRCYYGMLNLMTFQLLLRKTKCKPYVYKTIILPTVLYGSESWTLSKAHEVLLGGSERRILRRIYGAMQIDGVWRRRYDKELYSLFNDVVIIKRIKVNRLRRAGRVISEKMKKL
jgi:hypothetical protein